MLADSLCCSPEFQCAMLTKKDVFAKSSRRGLNPSCVLVALATSRKKSFEETWNKNEADELCFHLDFYQ